MNEKLFRRLLRAAAWVTVAGAVLGAIAFWRHIGWIERLSALLLPALAIAGIMMALLMW